MTMWLDLFYFKPCLLVFLITKTWYWHWAILKPGSFHICSSELRVPQLEPYFWKTLYTLRVVLKHNRGIANAIDVGFSFSWLFRSSQILPERAAWTSDELPAVWRVDSSLKVKHIHIHQCPWSTGRRLTPTQRVSGLDCKVELAWKCLIGSNDWHQSFSKAVRLEICPNECAQFLWNSILTLNAK